MNPIHWRTTLCILGLLATTTFSGCMAQRPYPYNRPSFHASRDRIPSNLVSRAQLARWNRSANDQLVATATMTANSSQELDVSQR